MQRLTFLSFILLLTGKFIIAQVNYETLYLQNDFNSIVQSAKNLVTADDFYWYALLLENEGNSDTALNITKEGLKKYPGNEKLEILLSDICFEAGRYHEAESLLLKHQSNPESFRQLIQVYEFRNNFEIAIAFLEEKIRTDSTNSWMLMHLGDNYFQLDSLDLALKYYLRKFNSDSSDQVTAVRIANIYLKQKKFDKSIGICNLILSSDSTNKRFIKLIGISHLNKKEFSEAGYYFRQLYEASDSACFIMKNLGICELNTYSFSDARNCLLRAYRLDSNDIETCFCLGKAFMNSMRPEKGLYFFNRADSLSQPDPKVLSAIHFEKQSVYSILGNDQKALSEYKQAYKYNPKPEYLFYMASLYQNKLEEKQKALEYYITFIESLPPEPEGQMEINEDQMIFSMRKIAENNILILKEELFFEGELNVHSESE